MLGYKTDVVYYARNKREYGESKYPLRKMLSFALDGITSFTVRPIRFILLLGFLIFGVAIFALIYSLIQNWHHNVVPGWTSLFFSIWAIGGIQMIAIGLIGEYIGKIYSETKHRPKYIVEIIKDK